MQKVYDKKNICGHMKVQVKKWTHEGPTLKKKKNDEHLKAHVLKKEEGRKIAMFQNNKL